MARSLWEGLAKSYAAGKGIGQDVVLNRDRRRIRGLGLGPEETQQRIADNYAAVTGNAERAQNARAAPVNRGLTISQTNAFDAQTKGHIGSETRAADEAELKATNSGISQRVAQSILNDNPGISPDLFGIKYAQQMAVRTGMAPDFQSATNAGLTIAEMDRSKAATRQIQAEIVKQQNNNLHKIRLEALRSAKAFNNPAMATDAINQLRDPGDPVARMIRREDGTGYSLLVCNQQGYCQLAHKAATPNDILEWAQDQYLEDTRAATALRGVTGGVKSSNTIESVVAKLIEAGIDPNAVQYAYFAYNKGDPAPLKSLMAQRVQDNSFLGIVNALPTDAVVPPPIGAAQ